VAAEVLEKLGVKFLSHGARLIDQVCENLPKRLRLRPLQRENFREFLYLNAAEFSLFSDLSGGRPFRVDENAALVSILKANTTLTAGCPPTELRIIKGKLDSIDLFLFRGDFQKFLETKASLAQITERPFSVARQFLGGILEIRPLLDVLGPAISIPSLPVQSLIWKLKFDVLNRRLTSAKIEEWLDSYETEARLRRWSLFKEH
jgi:hypothetical protein